MHLLTSNCTDRYSVPPSRIVLLREIETGDGRTAAASGLVFLVRVISRVAVVCGVDAWLKHPCRPPHGTKIQVHDGCLTRVPRSCWWVPEAHCPEVPDQLLAGSRVHRMPNVQLHSVNDHLRIASSRDFAASATQLLLIPKERGRALSIGMTERR